MNIYTHIYIYIYIYIHIRVQWLAGQTHLPCRELLIGHLAVDAKGVGRPCQIPLRNLCIRLGFRSSGFGLLCVYFLA